MTTRFKCIAMVLLFCITIPMFAEDVFSFSHPNSFFPNTINFSKEFSETNLTFNLDRMAADDVPMPKKSTNWVPIVITIVIIGGILIGGAMYFAWEG